MESDVGNLLERALTEEQNDAQFARAVARVFLGLLVGLIAASSLLVYLTD